MASTGSFDTNAYKKRYLTFSWKQKSQSIAENSTTFDWELRGSGEGNYISRNFIVKINGETVFTKAEHSFYENGPVVGTGTYTIKHQANGEKSFSASASAAIYYSATNVDGSGTWELNKIPRKAELTSAPNFSDEDSPEIRYSNLAGNAVTILDAAIVLKDGKTYIAEYRPIPKDKSAYIFKFTQAEQEGLWNICKDKTSVEVDFIVKSKIGGVTYTSKMRKIASIVNANPTVNGTARDTNSKTLAVTQDENKVILNASEMLYSISATPKKNATIKSYRASCGGDVYKEQSSTIVAAKSGTIIFEVTDSRGFSAKHTLTLTAYEYESPTITILSSTMSATGSLQVKFAGRCFNGKFGDVPNKYHIEYRIKPEGGSYGTDIGTIPSTAFVFSGPNNYSVTANIDSIPGMPPPLDYTKAYVVEASLVDDITFSDLSEWTALSSPIFAIGRDSFDIFSSRITGALFGLGPVRPDHLVEAYDADGKQSDLNNLFSPGVYAIPKMSDAGTILNCPITKSAGIIVVMCTVGDPRPDGTWVYVQQWYIPRRILNSDGSVNGIYIREGHTASNPNVKDWTKWYSIKLV